MPEPAGEFARIAAIVAGLPPGEGVVVGPGDDAAVLRPREGFDLVATTDTFVEGRHLRRELLSPAEAGARFAAANLSDLAAMAAVPRWALVSLVSPARWSAEDGLAFEHALAGALAADGAVVVGGNLASTDGPFSATVTLLGEVERGRAWTRAGARAGDLLAVTGVPGCALACVTLALRSDPPSRARVPAPLGERFARPASRVRFARALAAAGLVRAAIDISDGLAGDLGHLAGASGVGARVDEARLPADEPLLAAALSLSALPAPDRGPMPAGEREVLTHLRLGASDDYELLLALEPAAWERASALAAAERVPLAAIGEFTREPGLRLRTVEGAERPIEPRGWDHFRS